MTPSVLYVDVFTMAGVIITWQQTISDVMGIVSLILIC